MEFINSLETTVRGLFPSAWVSQYDTWLSQGHPHAKNLWLMNPFHVVLIILAYIMIVFVGKLIMKNRQPFELKTFSLLHNAGLVILSAYMCGESLRQAWINNYTIFGNGVDPSEKGVGMARILWIFYFSKTIEFIDTFIMVLKKNDRQISFLHMYHHATIFFIWWMVVYYAPGGDGYFSASQNSFVHVVMYSYYICATLKIPFPLKPYITMMQMFQFVVNMIQATYDWLVPTPYPNFLAKILFFYMISLLALFYNYFVQEQKRVRELKKQENIKKEK